MWKNVTAGAQSACRTHMLRNETSSLLHPEEGAASISETQQISISLYDVIGLRLLAYTECGFESHRGCGCLL